MTTVSGRSAADAASGCQPTASAAEEASSQSGIPNAPWWRCLHCGCDEYEEHVFTGHMKGVPMIHCANCKIMHSVPDPNSKAALRWQISELAEALSAAILEHDAGGITMATAREMRAALASVGEAGTATTTKIGVVHEHAVPKGDAHD